MQCLRKQWVAAGLADVGGVVFPWATVLGAHPYAAGSGGYAQPVIGPDGVLRDARTALRLEAEAGYVLAGAGRAALSARVQLPFYVDLSARYSLYWEPNAADLVAIGNIDVEVRLIDAIGIQVRLGVGVRHFQDGDGGLFGPGGLIALDLFLVRPLVLSVEAGMGIVGDALLASVRSRMGWIIDATEIYVGYHFEALLGSTAEVALGGPMLGARQWL